MVLAAKTVLVAVTLVCLASIGGAMLFAFPVLVPLHWLAARGSGPYATAGWAMLAGLSLFEAGWMITYVVTGNASAGLAIGALVAAVAAVAFVRRGADDAVTRLFRS